jgi:beta-glucanase (GH16 family)
MKKIILTISILIFCTKIFSQILNPVCGNWQTIGWFSIANCNTFESGDWVLVFDDEFNNNQIDRSKWYTAGGGWAREHGDELQYYKDENIVMDNGMVKLTAKSEPGDYDVYRWDANGNSYITQKHFDYTSGYLETKMKFEYGFFEIRCKIPNGKGFWPAFWLYGVDDIEGTGPEIDIFEFGGDKPKDHAMNLWVYKPDGNRSACQTSRDYGVDFSADFHTFSLEWDEFKMVYKVDGDIKRIDYEALDMKSVGLIDCQHHTDGYYTINPFYPNPNKPSSVILNLAVSCKGCAFGGPPNASTVFPSALEVDYIRIYKRKNPTKDISICNFDFTNESSIITGKTITVGGTSCNSVIESGKSISLIATDCITLLPGFHTEVNSNFSAQFVSNINLKSANNLKEDNLKEKFDFFDNSNGIVESYKIYPNPNNGSFTIELTRNLNEYQKIEVFDLNGNIIFQTVKFPQNIINIDLTANPKGIYLLRIISKDKIATNKIISQ